jgi:hypothetical protein
MDNTQTWSDTLENNIRNILRNAFNNDRGFEGSIPRNTAAADRSTNPIGEIELISDLIYEYTHNMRDYNANIRLIIGLIENRQIRMNQPPPTPATAAPRRTRSNSLRNNNLFMSFVSSIPMNQNVPELPPLTRQEIARSTITYGYAENGGDATSNLCPISLEPFQEGDVVCEIRGCRHKFKRPPLMNWFRRNSRCPVCRFELRNYSEPVDHHPIVAESTDHGETSNGTESANTFGESANTFGESPTDPGDDETPAVEADLNTNQEISNAFTSMIQTLLQNQNINTSDMSGNLLYEFQFPLR